MKDITINELVDLVQSDVPESESKLETMFQWNFEREMSIIKWLIGGAASITVAVLIALLKGEITISGWQIFGVVISALTSFGYGIYRLYQLREVHKQYVSALKLYCELKSIAPFINKYREALDR